MLSATLLVWLDRLLVQNAADLFLQQDTMAMGETPGVYPLITQNKWRWYAVPRPTFNRLFLD